MDVMMVIINVRADRWEEPAMETSEEGILAPQNTPEEVVEQS
jgi:hypothetical protein